jgi:hypothetical protein
MINPFIPFRAPPRIHKDATDSPNRGIRPGVPARTRCPKPHDFHRLPCQTGTENVTKTRPWLLRKRWTGGARIGPDLSLFDHRAKSRPGRKVVAVQSFCPGLCILWAACHLPAAVRTIQDSAGGGCEWRAGGPCREPSLYCFAAPYASRPTAA